MYQWSWRVARLSVTIAMACCTSIVLAQNYPAKPIRFLVLYAAGGATDIVARVIAPRLAEGLGQQVIVDNRPGANGIIATTILAKSPPDGYTILITDVAHGANPALHSKLPYDTLKDFSPISLIATMPSVLLVHPSLPVKTVKDLVALAKSKPGQLNYASAGTGSAIHLTMELFINATGINILQVPYKGGAPALTDVIGGQIPMMFLTIPPALQHVRAGRVRALGVTSSKRLASLPEVPTISESGVPGFEDYEWQGVIAPAGTPRDVIVKLHSEIVRTLAIPEVRERISGLGADVVGGTPEQLNDFIKAEVARWGKAIKPSLRID
jgi:tripartite-type tricarboxylate transporter receptor subunit TctC